MKRKIQTFVCLLIFFSTARAQVSVVKGKLYVFNSRYETGKTIYVNGATADEFYHRCNPYVTKDDGYFLLKFVGVLSEEKVHLTVTKSGWGVINTDLLFPVSGEKDTITIYMIPNGKLDESKRTYYKIGTTAGGQELKSRLAIAESKLKTLSERADASQAAIIQLKQQIDELNEDKKNLSNNSIELSERFAYMNLDIANNRSIKAFNLFKKGQIREALNLLNIDTLEKEADKFKAGIKKGDEIIKAGAQIKQENLRGIQQVVNNYIIGANLNINQANFQAADNYFRHAIAEDSLNIANLNQYGTFLIQQKHYPEAISIYQQLFRSSDNPQQRTVAKTNLGNLYYLSNSKFAFTQYHQALLLSEQLPDNIRNTNQGVIYNGLGNSYFGLTSNKDSIEYCFLKALSIKRQVLDHDSTVNSYFEYLKTASNLIAVYADVYDCKSGEKYAQIALPGLKKLSENNFEEYGDYYGKALLNYSVNLRHCGDEQRAVDIQKQSIKVYEELVSKNSEAFQPILASAYHNLAALYDDLKDYPNALEFTQLAIGIRQKYFEIYPDNYAEVLSESTINLCRSYYYGYILKGDKNRDFYVKDGLKRLKDCLVYLHKYNAGRNKQRRIDEATQLIEDMTPYAK